MQYTSLYAKHQQISSDRTEQDRAISLNHVIDWDQAKVIDRESNKMDRWIKEAIHTRKEQDKSMNRDEGSYQLSHIYDKLFTAMTSTGEWSLVRSF